MQESALPALSPMSKNSRFSRRERRLQAAGEAVSSFLDGHGGKERRHLTALWQNWPAVMDSAIASLGFPLGHKEHTLIIGADDSMALQELSLQSVEILERANAFMDSEFFRQVKVVLMQGQQDLARPRPRRPDTLFRPAPPPKPPRLGALLGKLDPESPVTRSYEAYIAMFASE